MSPEPSLTINTTITNTSMTYPEIWAETLEILKLQMPETTWERYLKRTRVSPRSNGKLVVVVAQPAQIEMLRTRMLAKIQAAVETVAGRAIPVEIE